MSDTLTLCVLLWSVEGMDADLRDYEDKVLGYLEDYGGVIISRLRSVDEDGPSEIQILEFPTESDLGDYMNDGRRLELAPERDRSIARTDVFRVRER